MDGEVTFPILQPISTDALAIIVRRQGFEMFRELEDHGWDVRQMIRDGRIIATATIHPNDHTRDPELWIQIEIRPETVGVAPSN